MLLSCFVTLLGDECCDDRDMTPRIRLVIAASDSHCMYQSVLRNISDVPRLLCISDSVYLLVDDHNNRQLGLSQRARYRDNTCSFDSSFRYASLFRNQ